MYTHTPNLNRDIKSLFNRDKSLPWYPYTSYRCEVAAHMVRLPKAYTIDASERNFKLLGAARLDDRSHSKHNILRLRANYN